MKIIDWLMDNWFKAGLLLVLLICGLLAYNAFTVYQDGVNERADAFIEAQAAARRAEVKMKEEQEAKEYVNSVAKRLALDSCLDQAYSSYSASWDIRCKDLGLMADCKLPVYAQSLQDERHGNNRQECLERFPQ